MFLKRLTAILLLTIMFIALFNMPLSRENRVEAAGRFLYWPVPVNKTVGCGYECYEDHKAIDIGVNTNNLDKIYAAASGKVVAIEDGKPYGVNRDYNDGYGNYVKIRHSNGFYTVYAHMSKSMQVSVNQTVSAGTLLGYGSSSGATCGSQAVNTGGCMGYSGAYWHLHFEVRNCDAYSCRVNPLNYLLKDASGNYINPPSPENPVSSSVETSYNSYTFTTGEGEKITYQSHTNPQGKVFQRYADSQMNWSAWSDVLNNSGQQVDANGPVQYVEHAGRLYQYIQDDTTIFSRNTTSGYSWTEWAEPIGNDVTSFSVASSPERVYIVFEGLDNYIYVRKKDVGSPHWSPAARVGTPRTKGGVKAIYRPQSCSFVPCQDQMTIGIVKRDTGYAHVTEFPTSVDIITGDELEDQQWFTSTRSSSSMDLQLFTPEGATYPVLVMVAYGTNGDVIYTHTNTLGLINTNITGWTQQKRSDNTVASTINKVNFSVYDTGTVRRLYYSYIDSLDKKVRLVYTENGTSWVAAKKFDNLIAKYDVDATSFSTSNDAFLYLTSREQSTDRTVMTWRDKTGVWSPATAWAYTN